MNTIDPIELKKRARRRLVGAAALALLAVIVLPMVMDEAPDDPRNHEIQVTRPGSDDPLASPTEYPAEYPAEPDIDLADPIPALPEQVATVTTPPPQPAPVTTAIPPTAAIPAQPVVKPPSPPANAGYRSEADRARAILEGRPPVAPEQNTVIASNATASARLFVQVGAFGEDSKAIALSNDLKKQGLAAFTERAGAVTRVRVGPFQDRQEAERAVVKLKMLGMDGVLTSR